MRIRKHKGAVMGLVVVSALVLIILGLGLLFMIMQLGGGEELQHATDAGNLNVAKQVLRRPGTVLLQGDELNHFADSDDPDTSEVNLLTFNKLVAQAFLVAANAQALNTGNANSHAQQLMNIVETISNRLNSQLSSSANFDQHFDTVAGNHAMRMFKAASNPVQHLGSQHDTSLMARGAATNVWIDTSQILDGGPNINNGLTVDGPNNKKYLVGYKQLAASGPESLWGVPLRPGLSPHLVSDKKFTDLQPRAEIPGFVPPNAFKSAGLATDNQASGEQTRAKSNSIVGSLQQVFPARIQRGVIIVDNTGMLTGTQVNGGNDIWTNQLMSPNFIEVLGNNASTGMIADTSSGTSPSLSDIQGFVNNNYDALMAGNPQTKSTFQNMLSNAGIDSWPSGFPADPQANAGNPQFIDFVKNNSISKCTNGSQSHSEGAPPTTTATSSSSQNCNLDTFLNVFNAGSGGDNGTSPADNLMAVEKFHMDICEERASGAECATIEAVADHTGLKKYSTSDCGLTQVTEGTLRELLVQTNATNSAVTSGMGPRLRTYLRQMNPEASDSEINGVLNTVVPMNAVSYIYFNPGTGKLILTQSLPPWPLPDINNQSLNIPDGQQVQYSRTPTPFKLDGITNCDGECGYPHPWDCPLDSQATGQDWTYWTPSSGFRNVLGVIKFRNQAAGGGEFCCPC